MPQRGVGAGGTCCFLRGETIEEFALFCVFFGGDGSFCGKGEKVAKNRLIFA